MKRTTRQVFWKISWHYTFIIKAISGTCNTKGKITNFDNEFKTDDLFLQKWPEFWMTVIHFYAQVFVDHLNEKQEYCRAERAGHFETVHHKPSQYPNSNFFCLVHQVYLARFSPFAVKCRAYARGSVLASCTPKCRKRKEGRPKKQLLPHRIHEWDTNIDTFMKICRRKQKQGKCKQENVLHMACLINLPIYHFVLSFSKIFIQFSNAVAHLFVQCRPFTTVVISFAFSSLICIPLSKKSPWEWSAVSFPRQQLVIKSSKSSGSLLKANLCDCAILTETSRETLSLLLHKQCL